MPVNATCPHCAKTYRLRNDLAGKSVECANCGEVIRVPDTPSEPIPAATAPPPPPPAASPAPPIPPRPRTPAPLPPPLFTAWVPPAPDPPPPPVYVEQRLPPQPLNLQNPYTYVIGACVILLLFILFIAISSHMQQSSPAVATPAGGSGTPSPTPIPAADFPPLGEPTHPAAGITMYHASFPTGAPSTQTMSLYLLLPDAAAAPVPCVFVAPAGTPLLVGSDIDPNDQAPELYPYVRAGYAACTYSLDGPISEHPTLREIIPAYDKFAAARFGLSNAERAMDFVAARAPAVDPDRFLVAGHSSAATIALVLAAKEPRIKAVAAYCPCVDISERNGQLVDAIAALRPDVTSLARDNSPINLASQMTNCPILIFGSDQDQVVSTARYSELCRDILAAGGKASVAMTPTGDHYHAMIHSGIPLGLIFFKRVLAETAPAATPPPP